MLPYGKTHRLNWISDCMSVFFSWKRLKETFTAGKIYGLNDMIKNLYEENKSVSFLTDSGFNVMVSVKPSNSADA